MAKVLNQPKPVYEEVIVDPWGIFILFHRAVKINHRLELHLPFDSVVGENRNEVMKRHVTWWRQYEIT